MIDISVIIPSKGSLSLFRDSLSNLRDTCSDNSIVEICVKVDTLEQKILHEQILKKYPFYSKVLYTPDTGFKNILKFIRSLCEISRADIMMVWADDVQISGDWVKSILSVRNERLRKQQGDIYIGNMHPGHFSFCPVITRRWFTTVGIGYSPYVDKWLCDVARPLGLYIDIFGIKVSPHPDRIKIRRPQLARSMVKKMNNRRKRDIRRARLALLKTGAL